MHKGTRDGVPSCQGAAVTRFRKHSESADYQEAVSNEDDAKTRLTEREIEPSTSDEYQFSGNTKRSASIQRGRHGPIVVFPSSEVA